MKESWIIDSESGGNESDEKTSGKKLAVLTSARARECRISLRRSN